MEKWISHPDAVEAKVAEWQERHSRLLHVDTITQPTGRPVFALTMSDIGVPDDQKKKLLGFVPHAHEPAPNAACMNVMNMLLTGEQLDGSAPSFDVETAREKLLVTFIPDANPDGTARAPVEYWDGYEYTNDEFWAWMRGPDRETGLMWKRVDIFDTRVEENLPTRLGIVYEPISEFEHVEPNRHPRSSLMRHIKALREQRTYDALLSLHQTEFVNSDRNCMIILPCIYDDQPEELREYEMAWARQIVDAWTAAGERPIENIKPLGYTGEQRQYFINVWGNLYDETPLVTSEVQNNNPATPPETQQLLTEIAITETIERLLE
ncbi:MAG TPA: hypothetical protein QGH10_06280 [Armatimonadota bacterium]|nr:hypothetical protein [Armatimonadota bacterium]